MSELHADDAIHGHQGRWIDNRGTENPVHVRYRALPPFAVLLLPCLAAARAAGFSFVLTAFLGVGGAALLARAVADSVTSERGFGGWARTIRAVLTSHTRHRAKVRARRPHRAYSKGTHQW